MGRDLSYEDPDRVFFCTYRTLNSRLWFINNTHLQDRILAFLARYAEWCGVIICGRGCRPTIPSNLPGNELPSPVDSVLEAHSRHQTKSTTGEPMRHRKYFPNKSVLFITTRVEEGLPLTPTYLNNLIFKGIFARAQFLFPVRVCHYVVMGNHLHLIIVVENGEDVSAFMGYLKGEISHSVNRLLGRRQRTIWQDGYDSPPLLTTADVHRYVKYIYLNPIRARLTPTIEEYPGLSSWQSFTSGNLVELCKHVNRTQVPVLYSPEQTINEQRKLTAALNEECHTEHEFVLDPYECFRVTQDYDGKTDEQIKQQLLAELEQDARTLREEHARNGKSYIGSTALRRQSMLKAHTPAKFGKRMICICSDLDLRKQYIEHFKALSDAAANAYREWKRGIFTRRIPPGMFAPRVPALASALRPY